LRILLLGTGRCGEALIDGLLHRGYAVSKIVVACSSPLRASRLMRFYEMGLDTEYLHVASEIEALKTASRAFDLVIVSDLETQRKLYNCLGKTPIEKGLLLAPYAVQNHGEASSRIILGYCDVIKHALLIASYHAATLGGLKGIEVRMERRVCYEDSQLDAISDDRVDIDSGLSRAVIKVRAPKTHIEASFVLNGVNLGEALRGRVWRKYYIPKVLTLHFDYASVEITHKRLDEYIRGFAGLAMIERGEEAIQGYNLLKQLISLGARVRILKRMMSTPQHDR